MLHIPNTVDARIAGKSYELAKKHILKVPPNPNLAIRTITAITTLLVVYTKI
jgi:hypothetical protein